MFEKKSTQSSRKTIMFRAKGTTARPFAMILLGGLIFIVILMISWQSLFIDISSSLRASRGVRDEMGKVVIMKPTKIEKIEDSIHQVYGSNRKDQCENMMIEDPIILIGTDGSGTRVPTRALSKMGITILVDPEVSHQMDIDGSAVGVHFTKLIRDLLCITGGSNYQLEDLPQDFREHLLSILRPWVDFVRGQACAAAKRRKNLKTFRFGFKKPDLMFLIPVLRYFWKDVKFVHILRDGRDMALSRNDATHEKYGAAMFGQGCDRSIQEDEMSFEDFMKLPKEARMALLWSRSNVGVEKLFSSSDFEDSRQLIRVEDMNAQDDRSVNTYTNLAKFANLNTLGVCMICEIRSQIQSTFMGSFDASLEEKKGKTKNAALLNYGKWKRLSSSDPDLLSTIELAARTGLQVFHYYSDATLSPSPSSSVNLCSRINCVV